MEFYPRNYIKKLILTNANHNLIIQIKHSNKKIMPKYIYIYIHFKALSIPYENENDIVI